MTIRLPTEVIGPGAVATIERLKRERDIAVEASALKRVGRPPTPLAVRFWRKVDRGGTDECWLWAGGLNGSGYGTIHEGGEDGRTLGAHRVAYELEVGAIPEGMQLDHLCRNRACVNPAHLEPVTSRENTLRGETVTARNARKTECLRGHPYTPENTYHEPGGGRSCIACRRASDKRLRALKALAKIEEQERVVMVALREVADLNEEMIGGWEWRLRDAVTYAHEALAKIEEEK